MCRKVYSGLCRAILKIVLYGLRLGGECCPPCPQAPVVKSPDIGPKCAQGIGSRSLGIGCQKFGRGADTRRACDQHELLRTRGRRKIGRIGRRKHCHCGRRCRKGVSSATCDKCIYRRSPAVTKGLIRQNNFAELCLRPANMRGFYPYGVSPYRTFPRASAPQYYSPRRVRARRPASHIGPLGRASSYQNVR